jgi:pimeloyl-ACP methyl ester carboxylesterase
MERTEHFFHYKQATLHYTLYGTGAKPLFCFHGFGLTGESFFELEKKLSNEYTLYNFDLFFHGKSEWKEEDKPISESFLAKLILEFNKEKNISSFSLLGYSIGARFVWTITNSFPDKVKEIIVLAPDGISTSFWYRLATGSSVSRSVFKLFLSHKKYGASFLKIGSFFKLVPSTTLRFVESQLQTKEQRDKVYKTWIVFRELKANNSSLANNINRNTIPLTIYLGTHDKIITYKTIQPLVEKIKHATIVVLEAGHSNLISKMVDYISYSSK